MTDEKVSQDAKSVQCARIFMYLENCILKKSIDLDKYLIKTSEVMLTTLTYSLKKTDLK